MNILKVRPKLNRDKNQFFVKPLKLLPSIKYK